MLAITALGWEVGDLSSDQAIVEAITSHDRYGLELLYSRYARILLGVAFNVLRDRNDAEDLLHDVFLEVWNKAGNYEPSRGSVKTWLVLLTRSRSIDRLRSLALAKKHGMAAASEEEIEASNVSPDRLADHASVHAAMERLNENQRAVIQMSYFEGLSCSDIARRCGVPLGTIKSRLLAAVKLLRAEFQTGDGQVR